MLQLLPIKSKFRRFITNYWLITINIFVYQKSFKQTFKTSLWVQNHFRICVAVLWIHNIYFWHRFGLANAINSHLRLKYWCWVCREFFKFLKHLLIEFVIPNLSPINFCLLEIFNTNVLYRYLIPFWICIIL